MDYKEVRKRDIIKKKGGTTEGRAIEAPKRVDYKLRRRVAVLCVLMVLATVLGIMLLGQNMEFNSDRVTEQVTDSAEESYELN